jgi:hypothetical protein
MRLMRKAAGFLTTSAGESEAFMGCAFFTLLIGVAVIGGGAGTLLWLGGRRIVLHLQQQPEAATILAEHLLMPLLAREEPKPDAKKVKGFTV